MKILGNKYKSQTIKVVNPKFPHLNKLSTKAINTALEYNHKIEVTCNETGEPLLIDKKIKHLNKEIKEGSKINIERWDGNGIHDVVVVKKIVDGVIICDEGIIPEWGSDFIWKGKKGQDEYYRDYHHSIRWENYWMKL